MLDQATWHATGTTPVAQAVGETAHRAPGVNESRSEPLDQYIAARQGPIEVQREVEIIGQLAQALARTHQSGLLHLNVRPTTIRIDAWARIAAFADAGHGVSPNGAAGRPDRIPGFCDLPYVSAEVLAREPAEESDDVYAFACVAYELLTGLHPYARRSALDALDGSFQPSIVNGLSDRQNTILLRALEPRRMARQVSMQELSSAFGGDSGSINAPMRVLSRSIGPHAHAAITAVAAFMLGIAVHSMWTHFNAHTPGSVATLPPTPWLGAPAPSSAAMTPDVPAIAPPEREPAAADASFAIDSKRIVLAGNASPVRIERERAADDSAGDRRVERPAEKSSDRGTNRSAEPAARASDGDASRGSAELPASRAALLQAQASAAVACPSCSCSDLGMKRFIAGVSLNWEEANFYLNVCGERG